jgi:hypothetical protein
MTKKKTETIENTFTYRVKVVPVVKYHYPHIKTGNQFKPDYQGLLPGEIVE